MGLTGATDLLDLRAMDTAEDVIVRFIDHDMHYPQGKGSKNSRKLLPGASGGLRLSSAMAAPMDAMARGEQDGCARRVCSPV